MHVHCVVLIWPWCIYVYKKQCNPPPFSFKLYFFKERTEKIRIRYVNRNTPNFYWDRFHCHILESLLNSSCDPFWTSRSTCLRNIYGVTNKCGKGRRALLPPQRPWVEVINAPPSTYPPPPPTLKSCQVMFE